MKGGATTSTGNVNSLYLGKQSSYLDRNAFPTATEIEQFQSLLSSDRIKSLNMRFKNESNCKYNTLLT
jgi:hypothetical protein